MDLAIEEYQKAMDLDIFDADLQIVLGKAYTARGDFKLAIKALEKANSIRPSPAILAHLGDVHLNMDKLEAGRHDVQESARHGRQLRRGASRAGQHLPAQAADRPGTRRVQDGGPAGSHLVQAVCRHGADLTRSGSSSIKPRKRIERAVEFNPRDAIAHSKLGFVYFRQSKLDPAIRSLKRALSIDPNMVEAHSTLGIHVRRVQQAGRRYRRVSESGCAQPRRFEDPLQPGRRVCEGWQAGQGDRRVSQTLELDAQDLNAHFNLALAYDRKRMKEDAIAQLQEAFRIAINKGNDPFKMKIKKELDRLGADVQRLVATEE